MLKPTIKKTLKAFGLELKRIVPPHSNSHPSETSRCRERLAPYCKGYGLDIGPGGDPITNHAVRVDLESPYSSVGELPVQLGGDATDLKWFKDGVLDFVYSSHVLEDFVETELVLKEWLRVIKVGGLLVLYCPDEQVYRTHCRKTAQTYNTQHKLENFSFDWVKIRLEQIDPQGKMIHGKPLTEIYSWEIVWQRGQ